MIKHWYQFKAGLYPTTRQAIICEFIKTEYQNLRKGFKEQFHLKSHPYRNLKVDYKNLDHNHEICFNHQGAYILLNHQTKEVRDMAFLNFRAVMWLFAVKHIDGYMLWFPDPVYQQIKNYLDNDLKEFFIKLEK